MIRMDTSQPLEYVWGHVPKLWCITCGWHTFVVAEAFEHMFIPAHHMFIKMIREEQYENLWTQQLYA